jgi:hypothetical protein
MVTPIEAVNVVNKLDPKNIPKWKHICTCFLDKVVYNTESLPDIFSGCLGLQ